MSGAPVPSINTNVEDDASELSLEGGLSRTASLDQGLSPPRQLKQDGDSDEGRGQSYLPQGLQQSKSKGPPKLSQLQEKWNQSFGSSVGSVHSNDSPVVYATINLPSIRSSMATQKANNTTSASRSTPPPKIDVTTTHTGQSLTPRKQSQANDGSSVKSLQTTPSTTAQNNNNNIKPTPPPPDMNAGLYYFAQIGPEQAEEKPVIETHQGSCQCGEIQLQLRLPSNIQLEIETTDESVAAEDKIYYRYIRVKQKDFDIVKGQTYMSTYFVTMFQPPIVTTPSPTSAASVTSNTSSGTGTSSSRHQKSKFFLRPNPDLTSPRSQSKGARVFCPQCGVYVLYVPGKNAPKVHLNINCFPTLVEDYPPPPPPPKNSQSLQQEAWFWDYATYSRYLVGVNNKDANNNRGPTGVALVDASWQWIQDHFWIYLPMMQDFVKEYLLLPSSGSNDEFLESKGVYLPSDTPKSARESIMGVEMAFQGTLTPPSGSFLEEGSEDEQEDLILDDIDRVMDEDGIFKEELLSE